MLKILYITTTQTEEEKQSADAEYSAIENQCNEYAHDVEIERLENPFFPRLLLKMEGYQPEVLHFSGTGTPREIRLLIDPTDNNPRSVNQEHFIRIVKASESSLKMLIFVACESSFLAPRIIESTLIHCVISFDYKLDTKVTPDFSGTLYKELLSGQLVQEAVKTANLNMSSGYGSKLDWNQVLVDPETYRLTAPPVSTLQEGNEIDGIKLTTKHATDDLGEIWRMTDPSEESKVLFRRFLLKLKTKLKRDSTKVESDIKIIQRFLGNELGVLRPVRFNLIQENPYIEYSYDTPLRWKSIRQIQDELAYPLDKKDLEEVTSIIFQLARIIDIAHHAGQGIVHGRLNTECIIAIDKQNSESETFGNLRPIVTDFGLFQLSDQVYKSSNEYLSPLVKGGNQPRKADDIYSIVAIWFWMLTGREPTRENVKDVHSWFFNDIKKRIGWEYEESAYYIEEVFKDSFSEHRNYQTSLSSQELGRILGRLIPDAKKETDQQQEPVVEIENKFGMKFTRIKAGIYLQGSEDDDPGHRPEEAPRRSIELSEYYMSQCVLTIQNLIDIANASDDQDFQSAVQELKERYVEDERKLPVTTVIQSGSERQMSWQFAKRICDVLNSIDDRTHPTFNDSRYRYNLPTEAQWEVACRAGKDDPFNTGQKSLQSSQANYRDSKIGRLKPVRSYGPNSWGLYDMHGNVWEFCRDYYAKGYDVRDFKNPKGFQPGSFLWRTSRTFALLSGERYRKVIRGGDFRSEAAECRSAHRAYIEDSSFGPTELHKPGQHQTVGVRLVYCVE